MTEIKTQSDDAARAALVGEPDTLPPTWCKKCAAEVLPEGKGRCPRCGSFLRLNFSRRTHPVNVLRRQQLLAKLVADYQPQTTMLLASCQHLAAILEQLETLKPGSPDHQRLVQLSQQLGTALDASRAPRVAPDDVADLTADQLVERSAQLLRTALELQRAAHAPPVTDPTPVDASPGAAGLPREALAPTAALAPEPARCAYCGQTPCIGPTHDAYLALHPIEAQQRADEEATKVMFKMLRFGNPY